MDNILIVLVGLLAVFVAYIVFGYHKQSVLEKAKVAAEHFDINEHPGLSDQQDYKKVINATSHLEVNQVHPSEHFDTTNTTSTPDSSVDTAVHDVTPEQQQEQEQEQEQENYSNYNMQELRNPFEHFENYGLSAFDSGNYAPVLGSGHRVVEGFATQTAAGYNDRSCDAINRTKCWQREYNNVKCNPEKTNKPCYLITGVGNARIAEWHYPNAKPSKCDETTSIKPCYEIKDVDGQDVLTWHYPNPTQCAINPPPSNLDTPCYTETNSVKTLHYPASNPPTCTETKTTNCYVPVPAPGQEGFTNYRRPETNTTEHFSSCGMRNPEPQTVQVTDTVTSHKTTTTSSTYQLKLFYAPWCGHCQRFKPVFEKLPDYLKRESLNVELVAVNGDEEDGRALCSQYNVSGFPTLVLETANGRRIEYDGDRSEEAIVNFLKQKCV
jgi:protein disulfide-isomerase-like protein